MATLALSIAGNAIAGPVGGAIGAAIGGIIDNALLFPTLFPKSPMVGPRVDDKSVQLASEGSEAKWILGPKNRPAGTVIYVSDLIEEEDQIDGGKKGGSATLYKYFVDIAVAVCDTRHLPDGRVFKVKKIWGDSKILYSNGQNFKCESITIYRGDQTTPDPLLEARLGAGEVPSYRNTCYAVIKKLALDDFGNRVPNMTFSVSQSENLSAGGAIELIAARNRLEEDEYDATRVSPCFSGMTVSGPQSAADPISAIMQAYAVAVVEADGQIKFVSRGGEDVVTVLSGDLAARESGEPPETRPYELSDSNDWALPREVSVRFVNEEDDMQQGLERARRTKFRSDNVVSMDLPLTMSPDDAKAVAKRVLWTSEAERQLVRLSLPPSYIHVTEGDVLSIGDDLEVFVLEITRGANYLLEIKGVTTLRDAYSQSGDDDSTILQPPNPSRPPDLVPIVFDGPALTDALADATGLYCGACAVDPDATFRGAGAFSSSTFAGTYSQVETLTAETKFGRVLSPPRGSGDVDPVYWDTESELVVGMIEGDLEGCTEQECLDGANRAVLVAADGSVELIGYRTVSPGDDPDSYLITNLLRGLKGTTPLESPVSFVVPSTALRFVDDSALLNSSAYYKLVSSGGLIDRAAAVRVECRGVTRTPLAPTHLRAELGPDRRTDLALVSSSSSTQTITRSGGFPFAAVGQYVTIGGSSDPTRNSSFLVVAIPDASTLELYSATASLGDESGLHVADGHQADVRITWSRRGKKSASIFSPGPTSQDENPVEYLLEVRLGGALAAPVRSEVVTTPSYVYGYADRVADSTESEDALTITVRQRSTVVGVGYDSTLEFRS